MRPCGWACGGLPGGSSLAQLLTAERGVRNRKGLPPFTQAQIVRWARDHRARRGEWPTQDSGPVEEAPGETWKEVNHALRDGRRALPGGPSLAQLLAERRGKRNRAALPPSRAAEILRWCAARHRRTGGWPGHDGGAIPEAAGETWEAVDCALSRGL